jgi:hypothetical protein
MNDKISFISDLLNSKKIESSQKEKIFSLTAKEWENTSKKDGLILKEIESIKEQIRKITTAVEKPPVIKIKNKNLVSSPKDVADFMYLFNQRNGFKYFTHDYDGEGVFDIENFLESAKSLFELKSKQLSIPQDLYAIVNQFAFNENPNWGKQIHDGFSTKKWIEWSKKNKLSPIRNKNFEKVINKFRDLTRVESPYLKIMIDELIANVFILGDFEIVLNRLDKADFYTNTNTFRTAIKDILEVIYKKKREGSGTNKLSITYKGLLVDNYYEVNLIITHHDSFPTKDFDQILEEWKGDKGAIGKIKTKLFGYCNWAIETKLEEDYYRINLLKYKDDQPFEKIDVSLIEGTKHILKFYYKTSD